MSNIRNILSEILRIIQKGVFDRDIVKSLMIENRRLIEFEKLKETYKFLNIYCNWNVHTQLSGTPPPLEILEEINYAIIENNIDHSKTTDLLLSTNKGLGLHKLREELIKLYKKYNLPSIIFEDFNNWRGFISNFIQTLIDYPIIFPENLSGPQKKVYERIMKRIEENKDKGGGDFFFKQLKFVKYENVLNLTFSENEQYKKIGDKIISNPNVLHFELFGNSLSETDPSKEIMVGGEIRIFK